jgi:hypothetical protein
MTDDSAAPDMWSRGQCLQAATIAGALLALALCANLVLAWASPLTFDDAYMFHRYALNLRSGLGLAWNPDGAPTYGLTSQLWLLFFLPFSYLPISPAAALQLASWLTGVGGLVVMGATVVRHGQPRPLAGALAAGALVLVAITPSFAFHLTTGMDTMLSLLANAALVMALLEYRNAPSNRRAALVGVLAFCAILARPDNGPCAFGAPFLTWLLVSEDRRFTRLLGLCALPALLVTVTAAASFLYFGTALPLSFYAKSGHGYAGFINGENPVRYMLEAATVFVPFLALLLAARAGWPGRLAPALLIPVIATFAYLWTVRQVMGFEGRYYIPFLPFLTAPALLAAVKALAERGPALRRRMIITPAAALLLLVAIQPAQRSAEAAYLAHSLPDPTPAPRLEVAAPEPLPQIPWFAAIRTVGDVAAGLPAGARVAASEVGYIGSAAPEATVIDLVGLNDTRIGMTGFTMDDLMARAPDLIWFPHHDYTGLRALILSDVRLLRDYVVVRDAFNYGVAIRRRSPIRPQVEAAVKTAWTARYPGLDMCDFTVAAPELRAAETC